MMQDVDRSLSKKRADQMITAAWMIKDETVQKFRFFVIFSLNLIEFPGSLLIFTEF